MFIGLDIGGTNIKALLTDRSGNILNYRKILTGKNAKTTEENITKVIDVLVSQQELRMNDIRAIGIGAAGTINSEKGVVITSPNIPYWKNYPIGRIIQKKTGTAVILENDATAAVVGEWWKGNGRKYRNWIMLTLGTGIGGGAIIDNNIYTGKSGSSMEFGHTTIDYRGKRCSCGNRGCLEQYASASAAVRLARRDLKKFPASSIRERIKTEKLTAKLIYEEAIQGDVFANRVFQRVATYLGYGIVNLVNIFDPEAVILAGGLSRAHKLIIPVVRDVVRARALPGLKENIRYLVIKDEEKSPALGAAKLAMDKAQRASSKTG